MAFQPGESGNPGGRKGNREWTEALRLAVHETEGDKKKLRLLAEKLVTEGLEGNIVAMKEIGDRLEGKPAQSVEMTGADGKDLIPDADPNDIARRVALLLKRPA